MRAAAWGVELPVPCGGAGHASGFNRNDGTIDIAATADAVDLLSITLHSLDVTERRISQEEQQNLHKEEPRDRRRCKNRQSEPLRIISLDEVAWHDTPDDCWLIIYDYVYDCTEFIGEHSGGQDVLLEYAGRDATLAFVGAGHPSVARETLENYLIGELPPKERIFRVPDGVKIAGI